MEKLQDIQATVDPEAAGMEFSVRRPCFRMRDRPNRPLIPFAGRIIFSVMICGFMGNTAWKACWVTHGPGAMRCCITTGPVSIDEMRK